MSSFGPEFIDPQDKRDLSIDWGAKGFLGADTIASSTWSIVPPGPVLLAASNTTTTTKTRVAGCTVGVTYTLTNHVTLASGEEFDRSIELRCQDL